MIIEITNIRCKDESLKEAIEQKILEALDEKDRETAKVRIK